MGTVNKAIGRGTRKREEGGEVEELVFCSSASGVVVLSLSVLFTLKLPVPLVMSWQQEVKS